MSKCYAVASGKGGVGKSTITANLAAVLALSGNRVAIVDADIGLRSMDAVLSLENCVVFDLIDLAAGDCSLSQALLPCSAVPGLFLLPASQFARAKELKPERFRRILQDLRTSFDYVFIDCPAGIERGLRNVLNAGVDDCILVATPDDISLRSAERTFQIIDLKHLNRPFLIVNRLDQSLIRSGEMMRAETAAQILDLPLIGEIPEDPAVLRASLKHTLFVTYDCEARWAVLRIASRIQGKTIPFPAYGCRKVPVFRRWFTHSLKEVAKIDDL